MNMMEEAGVSWSRVWVTLSLSFQFYETLLPNLERKWYIGGGEAWINKEFGINRYTPLYVK